MNMGKGSFSNLLGIIVQIPNTTCFPYTRESRKLKRTAFFHVILNVVATFRILYWPIDPNATGTRKIYVYHVLKVPLTLFAFNPSCKPSYSSKSSQPQHVEL